MITIETAIKTLYLILCHKLIPIQICNPPQKKKKLYIMNSIKINSLHNFHLTSFSSTLLMLPIDQPCASEIMSNPKDNSLHSRTAALMPRWSAPGRWGCQPGSVTRAQRSLGCDDRSRWSTCHWVWMGCASRDRLDTANTITGDSYWILYWNWY